MLTKIKNNFSSIDTKSISSRRAPLALFTFFKIDIFGVQPINRQVD